MATREIKNYSLLGLALTCWLVALSPVGRIAQGTAYAIALFSVVRLIEESKLWIRLNARSVAVANMEQELEQIDIELATQQRERELHEIYDPDTKEELIEALNHLYAYENAQEPPELQTSTSSEKALFLSIKALLEAGKSETFVIEKVLRLSGGRFEQGKQRLQQILEEGERNGWKLQNE